jgi:hypothetical protein
MRWFSKPVMIVSEDAKLLGEEGEGGEHGKARSGGDFTA